MIRPWKVYDLDHGEEYPPPPKPPPLTHPKSAHSPWAPWSPSPPWGPWSPEGPRWIFAPFFSLSPSAPSDPGSPIKPASPVGPGGLLWILSTETQTSLCVFYVTKYTWAGEHTQKLPCPGSDCLDLLYSLPSPRLTLCTGFLLCRQAPFSLAWLINWAPATQATLINNHYSNPLT